MRYASLLSIFLVLTACADLRGPGPAVGSPSGDPVAEAHGKPSARQTTGRGRPQDHPPSR